MESNNLNNNLASLLLGSNAYSADDTGFNLQILINKSLENGKQFNGDDFAMSDINNSLLNTLNMIDSNIKTDFYDSPVKNENTYTLDDLLDIGNEELDTSLFDVSLEDENLFLPSNQILMETAMASPLSSSSEESCDLDDLLFMDAQPLSPLTNANGNAVVETEVVDESPDQNLLNDHQYALEANAESSVVNMISDNGADLNALYSLLFQGQSAVSEENTVTEDNALENISEPTSPASTVSESDSVRYKPYKKPKTTEQKLRKKAQNRTAATRYRTKKKDELKAMDEEADQLEKANKELKGKVEGLRSEIDYLKNLMLDVIKARLAKGASPDALLSTVMAQ